MTRKRMFGAAVAATLSLVSSAVAESATITFTDRATWAAATGGVTGGENFDGFAADTSFDGSSLALASGMTIGTLVAAGGTANFVDAPAGGLDAETDVNGTAHANVFNGQSGGTTTPFISFSTSILAFGADFMNLNDNILRSQVELYSGAILLETLAPSVVAFGTVRFWGFVSDVPVTEIRFTRVANDVYGIDNIEISAVPEPATLLLLGTGLGAVAARRRMRKRA